MTSAPDVRRYAVERLRRDPRRLPKILLGLLKGLSYRLRYWPRLRGGAFLRVYGTLRIFGPGTVRLGRYVFATSEIFGPVVFFTAARDAVIEVGENASFNGTKIQAHRRVEIGRDCAIADAYITDSAGHALSADRRRDPEAPAAVAPVLVGRNVWISSGVTVLHGSEIGADSVIGAMSLVRGAVPAGVLAAGNPLRIVGPIPPSRRDAERRS